MASALSKNDSMGQGDHALACMHLVSALRENDAELNSSADVAHDLATKLMGQFYNGLRDTDEFKHCLARAQQPITSEHYCTSVPLIDRAELRCHLVTLSQQQPLPMHDHPNVMGLLMVVSGRLRVRIYDLVSCDESTQRVTLKLTRVDQLNEEEAGWVPRGRDNIHSMEALTDQVTLLTVHAPAIEAGTQRYYFPVSAQAELNQKFYARRLFLGSKKHII